MAGTYLSCLYIARDHHGGKAGRRVGARSAARVVTGMLADHPRRAHGVHSTLR